MTTPWDNYDALERALVAKGFPAMSAWWRAGMGRSATRSSAVLPFDRALRGRPDRVCDGDVLF
jgi:hypothetical protein